MVRERNDVRSCARPLDVLKSKNRIEHHLPIFVRKKAEDGCEALIRESPIWNANLPKNISRPSALGGVTRANKGKSLVKHLA